MTLKSFLSGFIAYVLAVVYSLLQGSSLKVVFLTGIKYLFAVTIIAFIFQLIFLYFSSQAAVNSEQETNKTEQKAEKDQKADQSENQETERDEFTEDFSPLNPPEIEYEE